MNFGYAECSDLNADTPTCFHVGPSSELSCTCSSEQDQGFWPEAVCEHEPDSASHREQTLEVGL